METYILHILSWGSEYSFLVALAAPLFGGEIAVLALAILAGQGLFPLWEVIVGGSLGMFVLDILWFLLFRFSIFERLNRWGKDSVKYQETAERISSFARGNDALILFISKAMVGTRILTLAFISMRKISFARFAAYDTIATVAWVVLLGYFGWAGGRGYVSIAGKDTGLSTQLLMLSLFAGACALIVSIVRWKILRTKKKEPS